MSTVADFTRMNLETAQVSLIGDRAENQDRVEILVRDQGAFAIVADGMGGHADGARAAETALACSANAFRGAQLSRLDPERFLAETIAAAHTEVLALGEGMPLEVKPGATVVCALILGKKMWWAHVGDSRAYHLRDGQLLARTRDHTEVESWIEAGQITPLEAGRHPGRHLVDYCLGVASETPPVALSDAITLAVGDVVLLCSDGLWSQIEETDLCERLNRPEDLQTALTTLSAAAAEAGSPRSDNVTVAALRVEKA